VAEYLYPASIEQAIVYLETYAGEARIIAGGTDVLPDIRRGRINPRCLVDVTRIPELDQITVTEDHVEIGAAVTFAAIRESLFLNRHMHALVDAARSVGARAIQNAATWVGNIVQAMPAADGAVVAVVLEAQAHVVDGFGAEWRPVESLFAGPGVCAVDPSHQFITHVRFPRPQRPYGTAWERIGRRPSLVLPILNCAVKLCLNRDGGRIVHACIGLGPVAAHPFRAHQAEAFLEGQPPTAGVFEQAGRLAQGESSPRSSVKRASREYRLAIVPVLVSEALATAKERASQGDADRQLTDC
jgi:carbon-monoxide dehydrogenase medium subunit